MTSLLFANDIKHVLKDKIGNLKKSSYEKGEYINNPIVYELPHLQENLSNISHDELIDLGYRFLESSLTLFNVSHQLDHELKDYWIIKLSNFTLKLPEHLKNNDVPQVWHILLNGITILWNIVDRNKENIAINPLVTIKDILEEN